MASRAAGARARAQLSLGVMAHGFSSRALCARPVLHLQVWGHHSTCKLARRPAQRPPWQGPRTRFKIRIQPTHPPGPAWRCSSVALLASMAAVNSRHRPARRPVTRARACTSPGQRASSLGSSPPLRSARSSSHRQRCRCRNSARGARERRAPRARLFPPSVRRGGLQTRPRADSPRAAGSTPVHMCRILRPRGDRGFVVEGGRLQMRRSEAKAMLSLRR